MDQEFWKGKDIIITGTSSGIGGALLKILAQADCRIFAVARRADANVPQGRAEIIPVNCDLAKSRDVEKLNKTIRKHTDKVDILVNNAGITAHGRFDRTDIDVFRKIFEINFFGTVHLTRLVIDMVKKAGGKILTVSTVSGLYGIPARSAYSATKSALHAVFESIGVEHMEDGVDSIIFCPPYVKTGLRTSGLDASGKKLNEEQHKGKILMPDDVAALIVTALERKKTDLVVFDISGRFVKWMRNISISILNRVLYKKLYKDFH